MRKTDTKSKRKLVNHIYHCQYMLGICNRKTNKLKSYYFKKQSEVAKKNLKQLLKSEKNGK
jgi:hypothetical protein